jgi:cell wall-associated NlpC family hydrolase
MTMSEYALKFICRPYIYGGDGSGKSYGGFDCSGLVMECLWAFGLLPSKDLTAQGIHDALMDKYGHQVPRMYISADDILFFGKDDRHISHVAIALNNDLMVEAGGGSSKCRTPGSSTGMVRVRPISSRKDLVSALRP